MENTDETKHKVLLVDDNEDLLEITTKFLQLLGFQVQSCNNGQKCIEIAQISNPDVILLDIEMPGMDGFATCEYIRKQSWGKNLPIIALTGYDKEDFNQRYENAGFNRHVTKPVDWQELSSIIKNVIASNKVVLNSPNDLSNTM
jgi:CheY-like chemotaxis protein